ncbi:hypothetical protein SAY87_003204 [Trapa incisa]|uniref:VQ domain-containing protein n=1 Tax=Trapa incisa TaxID=236973 RepID=A0AAN7QIV8_9MYRT|nr:hypothetical protein SAY87_003204 [Trapa incisa]
MAGDGKRPLRVVIIDTQYVETDARSFKSVVQRLTGKDSTVDSDSQKWRNADGGPPPCSFTGAETWAVNASEGGDWWMREFDRLLKEAPLLLPPSPPPPWILPDEFPDLLWELLTD